MTVDSINLRTVQPPEQPRGSSPAPSEVRSDSPARTSSGAAEVSTTGKLVNLQFEKDESTGKMYMELVDRETGEVLRQIPPEETRNLAAALREMDARLVDRLV